MGATDPLPSCSAPHGHTRFVMAFIEATNGDQIPEETATHRNSRWDIPRKRALFTSDGPDSTTSGSDTPESHADRPPEVEYSERLMTEKRQDEGGTERLCSPHMTLEMAVIQLQKASCTGDDPSIFDRWSVHSADIWTVWDPILPCQT